MTKAEKKRSRKRNFIFAFIFLFTNIIAVFAVSKAERFSVNARLTGYAKEMKTGFENIMGDYERSFRLFVQMMSREIENNPDPDIICDYLKNIDPTLLAIEGDSYDGLYMYYQERYLYSWDTPYSVYEETGYVATERPWYKDAAAGKGEIVFTPPYMSYANHYILTTVSQMQPDGKTVFAYDIKMGDIQNLVSSMEQYENAQMMICNANGTVIGCTREEYLGGDLYASPGTTTQEEENPSPAFDAFRREFDTGLHALRQAEGRVAKFKMYGRQYYGCRLPGKDFDFLIIVPQMSMLLDTMEIWMIPLLITELLLVYILSRISRIQKDNELREAYIELGQTQKRLEIALRAAQKAAAIDELTGMMNSKSFYKAMGDVLETSKDSGILIMVDGDHFKQVNDNYGHSMGDEVIKLSAQMIVGRIRTVDLAARLHGDEFAIFISHTPDYSVAEKIMKDINETIAEEAKKRNMPAITLSAGAVIANPGDHYAALAKAADAALYRAKETHNGAFAY